MTNGTGALAKVPGGWPQAGKTGTTNDNKTTAFAGYTPNVAGFATIAIDNKSPWWAESGHAQTLAGLKLPVSGTRLQGFGAQDAGRIWKAAMTPAIQKTEKTPFPKFTPINLGWTSSNTYTPPPPSTSLPPVAPETSAPAPTGTLSSPPVSLKPSTSSPSKTITVTTST